MEDRSGERRARFAFGEGVEKVFETPRAARSDDGNVYRFGDGARQLQIITIFVSIAIHAGQQNLSRPQLRRPPRPFERVNARRGAPAVQVDLPALRRSVAAFGVNGDDDTLRPESLGAFADQIWILHGGGVDRDFIRPGLQNRAYIVNRANAAPDRERDEDAVGHAANHVGHDLAPVGRGGDVQKDQLVGALAVAARALFDRVPCVNQVDETDPFDHATAVNVQTWNDAFG